MKIEKKNLMKILQKTKPGLATKAIIEQFTHFIFSGSEVMTYNDEICICHPFESDFKTSVKADDLWKLLSGVQGEGIDIRLSEGDAQLLLRTGKTEAGLSTVVDKDAEEMIQILDLKSLQDKWIKFPDPEDFIRGAGLCMFSASRDMTKGHFTCIHIENDKIISTDSVRISKYKLKDNLEVDTLIPAKNILQLMNFDITHYFLTDNWMHFRTEDGVTFSTRIMEGKFPDDIEDYFDIGESVRARLPSELKEVIDSIAFMTEGEIDLDRSILMKIGEGEIFCKAEKKIGWVNKKISFEYKQDPFKVVINPMFLSQVLEKATTMKANENMALFLSGSFSHIISLHEETTGEGYTEPNSNEQYETEEDDIPF